MARIHFQQKDDLTIRVVEGSPDADELLEAIHRNYEKPTAKICWLLQPDTSEKQLTVQQAKTLSSTIKELGKQRPGGKSAIVAGDHFGFAMGRVFESHNDAMEMEFQIRVFRTKQEAAAWLEVDASLLSEI